jgi:hypothetical protein
MLRTRVIPLKQGGGIGAKSVNVYRFKMGQKWGRPIKIQETCPVLSDSAFYRFEFVFSVFFVE